MTELFYTHTNVDNTSMIDMHEIHVVNEEYNKLLNCLDHENVKNGDFAVIEYYLPTCEHCKRYDETFKTFAELVEGHDDINTCQVNFATFKDDKDVLKDVLDNIIHISPEDKGLGFPLTVIYDLYNHMELDYKMGNIPYYELYNFVNHYKIIDENNHVDPHFGIKAPSNN